MNVLLDIPSESADPLCGILVNGEVRNEPSDYLSVMHAYMDG